MLIKWKFRLNQPAYSGSKGLFWLEIGGYLHRNLQAKCLNWDLWDYWELNRNDGKFCCAKWNFKQNIRRTILNYIIQLLVVVILIMMVYFSMYKAGNEVCTFNRSCHRTCNDSAQSPWKWISGTDLSKSLGNRNEY